MKVWDSYGTREFTEFLTERGVDMPRAWSRFMREQNCVNDRKFRPFAEFLQAEYPVHYAAWRVLK